MGVEEGVQAPDSESRKVQQQVQGPVVRWDRFLPFRSLKALLVENDDCTRHVVSALLRNCSYEVVAVANGVRAWRYLEDLTNHIDLILTEVVMPVISGIGLLYKIMNHKTIKNIPVIMMSSHDSMGIVFKCLSRGAVDFLVKPIRKNELKNLWQHVWRRCQSSSGSGSESGTMSRKSVRSKSRNIPNNFNRSNEHEYGRIDSSSDDDDDDDDEYESSAQSSWTKNAADIGSLQPTEDGTKDAPDSTCALVIQTKPESISNGRENVNVDEESEEQFGACKDQLLEQGNSQHQLSENPTTGQNKLPELEFAGKPKTEFDQINKEDQHAERVSTDITSLNMQLEANIIGASNGVTELSFIDNVKLGLIELPVMGLRSEIERYTCGSSLFQDSQKDRRNLLPLGSDSIAAETMHTNSLHSSSTPVQLANGFIDRNSGNATPELEKCADVLESSAPQNAGQAVQKKCTVQPVKIEKVDVMAIEVQMQPRESQQVHVEHHHHYHHYHHHIHDVQHHQTLSNQDQCSFENPGTAAIRCASPNTFMETCEITAGNFSMTGSGSGSHHGSNGKDLSQHGSNGQDVITNSTNDDDVPRNSANDIVNMNNLTTESDEDGFTQREAGMTKLRQKRKERSFENKVRIQGRRKVADQRTCEQYLQPPICDAKAEDDTQLNEHAFGDTSSENVR
ncbi:unnamed protein product [Rhodiola kirilowii]